MIFRLIICALLYLTSLQLYADDKSVIYSVEVDPAPYLLSGYAVHFRMTPASSNWRYGIGAYALEFPDTLVNLNSQNKDRGWNVELDNAVGLFAEYLFNKGGDTWLAGMQLARHNFRITNDNTGAAASRFDNILLMPYGGYSWNISAHTYLTAWFGVGYTDKTGGDNRINNLVYDINPIVPYGAMHLGYRF